MGTLASGSIDLKSLKKAGEGASKYITAIDGDGIKVHAENNINVNYALINSKGMEIFQGKTDADSVSAAKFGTTTRVGKTEQSHVNIDYHSLQLIDKEQNTYFWVSDLRDENGLATFTEYYIGTGGRRAFLVNNKVAEPVSIYDSSNDSNTAVLGNIYSKAFSFDSSEVYYTLVATRVSNPIKDDYATYYTQAIYSAFPNVTGYSVPTPPFDENCAYYTVTATLVTSPVASNLAYYYTAVPRLYTFTSAPASNADVRIKYKTAITAAKAYTLGRRTADSGTGNYSCVEGANNIGSGYAAHVEGVNNKGIGNYVHVEGTSNIVEGQTSHAEGTGNIVTGYMCHVEGLHNIADGIYQHVQGKYNKPLGYDYLFIIGNGESDTNRSNALTVDREGYLCVQGHSTPIGTLLEESASGVSIASSTDWHYVTGCQVELTPGSWIISYSVMCSTLASGKRLGGALKNPDNDSIYYGSRSIMHASNSSMGAVSGVFPCVVTNDATSVKVRLMAFHTQGSKQNVSGYIRAMRIA